MGEDKYDPPIILGRLFLSTVKAIIYIGTEEVHMHLPSEKVHRYFTDPNYIVEDSKQVRTRRRRHNRNQRRQIIKDGCVTPGPVLNRINRRLIPTSCNFFSGSPSPKNSKFKRAWPGEI